ncbi:MAG: GPW/gp25 family protein [Acidobacteria bacterium]|nr:GPW/gp25 family protein [Acidobacteriota bacterium]
MNLDFPYRISPGGRTAVTGDADHVRDLIEQLLFTSPGERVNRPDFGSGLRQLVFAPASTELAAALQFTLQGALAQYLGDRIEVQGVAVTTEDSRLEITVRYRLVATGEEASATFGVEG